MNLDDLFNLPGTYKKPEPPKQILVPRLAKLMESENRKLVPPAQEPVFRASGLGYCPRYTLYSFGGYEDAKTYQEVFTLNQGTKIHDIIQEYLKKDPNLLLALEDEITNGDIPFTNGHFDGLLNIDGEKYLLEIKSQHVEAYQRMCLLRQPYKAHIRQAHFYMRALNVDKVIFLYVNSNKKLLEDFAKENPDVNPVFCEIVYNFDEAVYSEIKDSVDSLVTHFRNKTKPVYKTVSQCSWCQFREKCLRDNEEEKIQRREEKKKNKQK